MTLSEKLFALRRQAGLSQEELAERLGISRQAVGKWENGTATPELQKLRELARLYQITLGELLGDAPAPAEPLPPPAPPSPPRRRRWPTVLLLLTLAIILLWTAQLHSQVAQLRSQLNDQYNGMYRRIDNITWQVQDILEQQALPYHDFRHQVTDVDLSTLSYTLQLQAVPIVYTADTQVHFTLTSENGGTPVTVEAVEGEGHVFQAAVVLSGWDAQLLRISVTNNGETQIAEALGLGSPLDTVLPSGQPNFFGSIAGVSAWDEAGRGTLHLTGELTAELDNLQIQTCRSLTGEIWVDEQLAASYTLPASEVSERQGLQGEDSFSGHVILTELEAQPVEVWPNASFRMALVIRLTDGGCLRYWGSSQHITEYRELQDLYTDAPPEYWTE